MEGITRGIWQFVADESGATAVEYGLMVALIALVIVAAVITLGTNLKDLFNAVAGCIANPSAATCKWPAGG